MKIIRPIKPGIFPRLGNGVHTVALGNMTQYRMVIVWHWGEIFCGIEGKGCYAFNHPPDPGYLAVKLNIGEGDASNVADFVTCQFIDAHDNKAYVPKGNYYENLLEGNQKHQ